MKNPGFGDMSFVPESQSSPLPNAVIRNKASFQVSDCGSYMVFEQSPQTLARSLRQNLKINFFRLLLSGGEERIGREVKNDCRTIIPEALRTVGTSSVLSDRDERL